MPFSFNLISLGCPKNQVDSEAMFTRLEKSDIKFTSDIDNCDICVINTCGFIEAARKESIGVIMEAVGKKQAGKIRYIAVAGCMVNNNLNALKEELPEVDLFLPTFDEEKIVEEIAAIAGRNKSTSGSSSLSAPRLLFTIQPVTAIYLIFPACFLSTASIITPMDSFLAASINPQVLITQISQLSISEVNFISDFSRRVNIASEST